MKKVFKAAFLICFCTLMLSGLAFAGNSDTITVNYEVQAINEINIDGAAVNLTINSATAGAQPDQVTDSTTYDITTNCADNGKKLTAAIDTAMPANVTLRLNMTAPGGAVSAGAVVMTDSDADVVTGIDAVAQANINMTFTLDAMVGAHVVGSASKTLTLTLTDS
jgi:hypothetical protein